MDPPSLGFEPSHEELPCLPPDIATNKASSTTPPRDEYNPQNDDEYDPHQRPNTPIPTDDEDQMRRKLNLRRDAPNMAASTGFLTGLKATAVKAADEQPTHTIRTASASTVLAEHDEYVRNLHADWDALPSEFPYKRSKRDKRKSRAKYAERKKKLKNPTWEASLEELDELAKNLRVNQEQWSDPEVMMKKVVAKMKKEKKKQDKTWYEKMLAGPWKTSGPSKKLRRTIDGWEEVDIEDDEAEAMAERKQFRKRQIFPYNTWRWDELSSSDEAEARERRVVAAAIKILEKPVASSDEDDEPIMHSLLSDDEVIAADPPVRTKEEKAEEKAKKQEAELVAKEKMAREELRPLLHPFFRSDKHSADHILHAGALPVEMLKQSQFFPVSADVRKAKAALYKQKYEENMAVKAKKDKVKRDRAAKKQRRFAARREKRSAYAHRLAVKGWDFPEEALTGYEDAIAKARIIPVVAAENTRKAPVRYKKAFFESTTIPLLAVENSEPENADLEAPKQLLPTLPLAPEHARDLAWTFPVWDDEMAWTEYDTLPGRFEAISKIIKDDDWNDQFVKGSKLDQELMRTIVMPVWNSMTYEEKTTVLGGQRVDPACFWSDYGDEDRSYVSGSPKMVDPFDIEGSDWVPWSHPSDSDPDSIKLDMFASNVEKASFSEGEINEFDWIGCTSCTDKASFDEREKNVSDFLESVMSSSGTEKASFDEDSIKESDSLQLAKSSLSAEKPGFDEGEMNKSGSLKSAKSSATTEKASFGDGEMYESRAVVQPPTTSEDSFGSSDESARSPSSPEKASFEEEETNEADSWQSASFSSNIQRASFDQEETDGSSDDPQTTAAPEDSLASSAAFDNDAEMPDSDTLKTSLKEVNLSDFEEPLDDPDPDSDLNILFQRVGAFCQAEEASPSPFNSGSSREAELIYNLLRKEAVVCHWFPERTLSYDNVAWKTRVSIFDPENKDAVNLAVFPPVVKKVRNIEYSDPERMDLSIPRRNNVLRNRPDIQMNWLAIADEYSLGLNGRQRLTKPEWAKNYDLIRAQQADPLIYMPQDTLEFEEVGYFLEVLPKPLVFLEVKEKSYDNADWIWQKHCMDQRIGLHPRDQRPDPNATISDKSANGLIGDNLPPDDQSFDTSRSFRDRGFSGDDQSFDTARSISDKRSSGVPSFKLPDIPDVPAEVGAQMLKELEELEKPIPETEALGRPPPAKYIQPDGTPAAVLMKLYQEEYEEFRKECPEPTSIRFDREVYTEAAPLSPEKKAKQDMDDYLAQMNEEDYLDFLKDVANCINELVAPGLDVFGPVEGPVETSKDFTPSLGSVRRKLDFKPKLKGDELDMKQAREGIPISGSVSVMQKACTPVAPPASGAGQSDISGILESLSRRSERHSLRELVHEKPAMSPRARSAMDKAPSVTSVSSSALSRNLNIALDASKARILQKMKDRGESAEKQASMAGTLDSFKHPEPAVPEPEPEHGSPILPCNRETKKKEAQPAGTRMTPAKARAFIDYLVDDESAMEEDELKENIIHFFGERFFAYAMTRLDLSPVDVSEEEANAFLQQRFEAHRLIEEAEEAKAKEVKAKEIEPATMSKSEAQYLFQSTMTPAKARTLLDWAKRTQPHLYIKHMLAPGLVEYCETELDAAPMAVTEGDSMKFLTWNMKMRESGQNLMELRPAVRVDDDRTGEDKSELDASPLFSAAKGRTMVEWLFRNRPDLEVMKLLSRKDLDRIIGSKNYPPVQVTENEAVAFFNILSKRAMEIRRAQRDQDAQSEGGDETFPLFEEETQRSNSQESLLASHGVDDPEDGSEFDDTFENDPNMPRALAVQLIAWVLDVRPDCNPKCVLGEHFIRYVSQYQGPKLGPLEDDEAFLIFKKYALAQQVRTRRTNVLHEGSEQKPNEEDDACSDVPSHHSGGQESVLEKFPNIEPPVPSRSSGSESSELEKFPDIDINSPPKPEKTSDTVRLRLKPSQVREFLEYLTSIHGHCDFKDQDFGRIIKAYIQLPDSAPTKDFPFRGEGLDLFKQMVMAQLVAQRKRQRAFDEGRVAYAYGAGTDPVIRRERGEKVEDDVEEAYNPYDDMYDGIAKLFGSMSSVPRFDSPSGSFRSSFRCSFGSSFGGSSTNEWPDLPSEMSGSVKRRANRGLFIRKRLSHTFDPVPGDPSSENGRLHLRRNPSYRSQHEADRNEERSSSPLMSASPGRFGLGLSLPEHEQNENEPQSPTPARRIGANRPLRASVSERSSSPMPPSEDSDNPWRPLLEGSVMQRLSASGAFPSRGRAETPPPASSASWPSEDSYQNSTDWGTGSSASMTFSQFQAMRRNYRLEEANMSASFPPHGHNPFGEDVEADNAGRGDEGDDISDLEAYEAWYNAKHGVSPDELEEGRRYFKEEQMIDELEDDPEMLEKVLGILAKIDVKVAEAHAQAVEEARKEEEKEAALRGDVPSIVDDDPAHLFLHAPEPKKEFKKTLLKAIQSEHLDAEEIEMLLEKIDEREAPSEYEWVDENGEPLESDWEDESDEEDDIDQDYHVQEHQERMQLNFEQCEYEGALARVEAWRDTHMEHADPDFPQREKEADEARMAEDKKKEAIVKAWEASKAPLTVPHRKRGRRFKSKDLRKKERASLGNTQNSQGPFPSEPEALPRKEGTPLLKDQTSQGSVRSRRSLERVSFQITVEDEPLGAEQREMVADTSIPREVELSRLKSFESGGYESKDADIRVPSPTPSLRSASDDASNEALRRKKTLADHLGFKSKDMDVSAPSPTPSIRSVSRGASGMPSRKLTKTRKPSADVAGPPDPSLETFSPKASMAPSETAPGPPSLVQRMSSGYASIEPPLTKKSIKARLGLTCKDLNTGAPLPTPSFRSVSHDLPRRTSKKLIKKRKPGADDTRPSTPSREIFSPSPSMAPSESAPRSTSLGQRVTSIFKRKDKEEVDENEESGSSMMKRMKSLKFKKRKD